MQRKKEKKNSKGVIMRYHDVCGFSGSLWLLGNPMPEDWWPKLRLGSTLES